MADPDDVIERLSALGAEYQRLDAARLKVRDDFVATAVEAFLAGREPSEIYAHNPFSDVWLRGQARDAGVPPASPGPKAKPRKRAARMPGPSRKS